MRLITYRDGRIIDTHESSEMFENGDMFDLTGPFRTKYSNIFHNATHRGEYVLFCPNNKDIKFKLDVKEYTPQTYTESLMPSKEPKEILKGWVCPVCEAGVSPFTIICPCNSKENDS